MALSSVSITPLTARPSFVPGTENDPTDVVDALSLGPPFQYIIPGFDVLRVELRQLKVAFVLDGVDRTIDLFVPNQSSLCHSYPARMTIKGFLVVDVSSYMNKPACDCWGKMGLNLVFKWTLWFRNSHQDRWIEASMRW